jgi:hypothetical protein
VRLCEYVIPSAARNLLLKREEADSSAVGLGMTVTEGRIEI